MVQVAQPNDSLKGNVLPHVAIQQPSLFAIMEKLPQALVGHVLIHWEINLVIGTKP